MEKCCFLLLTVVMLVSSTALGQSGPNEPPLAKEPVFTPSTFGDSGLWLPALDVNLMRAEPDETSGAEEALFATYSFSIAGTTYNVEFYYRELYDRLRARVFVGDRELRGLFNRFYSVSPTRGLQVFAHERDGSPELFFNFGFLPLKESPLDTDVIYDTVEKLAAKSLPRVRSPSIRVSPPPGMLKRTCRASVWGGYLVNEEGQIGPFTLKNLLIAYCQEGIRAEGREDFERIGRSLVEIHGKSIGLDCTIVSDVNGVRRYSRWFQDSVNAAEITPPVSYSDPHSQMDYWSCYACVRYKMGPLILTCYRFGFQNGLLRSAQRTVLGENAFGAYAGYPNLRNVRAGDEVVLEQHSEFENGDLNSEPARARDPMPKQTVDTNPHTSLALLRVAFVGAGVLLLASAYVVRRYVRVGSRVSKHGTDT